MREVVYGRPSSVHARLSGEGKKQFGSGEGREERRQTRGRGPQQTQR